MNHTLSPLRNANAGDRPHRPRLEWTRSRGNSAAQIAKALAGRRSGRGWTARCPAHDDHDPSLSISETADGLVLVHCFAGCAQDAVITALKARQLWHDDPRGDSDPTYCRIKPQQQIFQPRDAAKIADALDVWKESVSAVGSVVETYLGKRGLMLPPRADLRFHPSLRHKSGNRHPAMVGLVTDPLTAEPIGIHRTFLTPDGAKLPLNPQRMLLGCPAGGVIRLAPESSTILLGEGIETTLAGMLASQRAGWAVLSATNMKRVRVPDPVQEVILLIDGDEPGRTAASVLTTNLIRCGKRVRQSEAPNGFDFNDIIMGVII